MSFLSYNGIQADFLQTRAYREEQISLGQDRVGTRNILSALIQVHRRTVQLPTINGVAQPLPADGAAAFLAIRDGLMEQRQAFRWNVGSRVLANVFPAVNLPVGGGNGGGDVELGPKPLACNVVQINSTGTFVVEYTIQWATPNDCPANIGPAGKMAVLGHAWSGEDEIDDQYFLTRTYQGRVHFDPRVVGNFNGAMTPDKLRRLLLPQRAAGMIRDKIVVKVWEDGYTMDYLVVDRQPQAFCNSEMVTGIQAEHTVVHTVPTPQEYYASVAMRAGAASGVTTAAGTGVEAARKMRPGSAPLRYGMRYPRQIAGATFDVLGRLSGFAAAAYEGIPIAVHTVEATAFGSPRSTYFELARAARVVALFRMMKGSLVATIPSEISGYVGMGGVSSQSDSADPKSSSFKIEVRMRPRARTDWQTYNGIWAAGKNTMPTIPDPNNPAAPMQERPILDEDNNAAVPSTLKQLIFGGTIGGVLSGDQTSWGWGVSGPGGRTQEVAFAPDFLSQFDAGVREVVFRGIAPSAPFTGNLPAMLLQALQDPCGYKAYAALNDAPVARLP